MCCVRYCSVCSSRLWDYNVILVGSADLGGSSWLWSEVISGWSDVMFRMTTMVGLWWGLPTVDDDLLKFRVDLQR